MSSLFGKRARRQSSHGNAAIDKGATHHRLDVLIDESSGNSHYHNITSTLQQSREETLASTHKSEDKCILSFDDLKLSPSLLKSCKALGFRKPTPVQRIVIPFLLNPANRSSHLLALAATGSGKTAAFVLPILHHLSLDPYGIYAVVISPTRELAKQIHEQVMALGTSSVQVRSSLVIGGMDMTQQACELEHKKPHFCIATPGRLASILRGPNPPVLKNVRFVVLDEADRLLTSRSGFERDVAEILLHTTTTKFQIDTNDSNGKIMEKRVSRTNCQTLLFSATLTRSLESLEELAGAGMGRLPLTKFVIQEDGDIPKIDKSSNKRKLDDLYKLDIGEDCNQNDENYESSKCLRDDDEDNVGNNQDESIPCIPAGLRLEYIFMPSQVRDGYLVTTVRHLMVNGGRFGGDDVDRKDSSGWNDAKQRSDDIYADEGKSNKAKSAIIFVSTCERAALISGVLTELGVGNVALHSLLSQNRRLAALAKFKSQQVRILVATDVASRGLDIPTVDLVINTELPRKPVDYIHRVGRTARAGRRGRAVSLVGEADVALVHAAEKMAGRRMDKCEDVTDDMALKILGAVTKALRLTKLKLDDIGFDELVKKMKERKIRDRKERQKAEKLAKRALMPFRRAET